ncbi:beta-lactamase superfamily domain-containing protein [Powellomyces hirtus]|nr:beta-lactamase superfamily domain-containing protein [Powellomyces hirtus]
MSKTPVCCLLKTTTLRNHHQRLRNLGFVSFSVFQSLPNQPCHLRNSRSMSQATSSGIASASSKGNKAHHLPNGRFTNPWPSFTEHGLFDFLKLLPQWDRKGSKVPIESERTVKVLGRENMDWSKIKQPDTSIIQATWLGHASFLIQMEGVNIICDPVFEQRCSPMSFMGPARFTPPACTLAELRAEIKIDVCIISHNHYDHLETTSIAALGPDVQFFVPLKNKAWFDNYKLPHVYELDWWDKHELKLADGRMLQIVCTPCQHFSGRGLHDRMSTLWAGWAVLGQKHGKHFYFGGDTGYRSVSADGSFSSTCPVFKEIGTELGPFDLSCIPIGAYSPRPFMSPVHLAPEDSVEVHKDVKSQFSVGMHWGTFVLTDEPVNEPPQRLRKAMDSAGLSHDDFVTVAIGETVTSNRVKQ